MAGDDETANYVRQTADLLRGRFRADEYASLLLPMMLLRCLDMLLAPTREDVLLEFELAKSDNEVDPRLLREVAGLPFYNLSSFDFRSVAASPKHTQSALLQYASGFSENVRDILDSYDFEKSAARLQESGVLQVILSRLSRLPSDWNAEETFARLVSEFTALSRETRGDSFTPRDVVRVMTALLFTPDRGLLISAPTGMALLDPSCGTGGNLAGARRHLREIGASVEIRLCGQEISRETWATAAASEMLARADQPSAESDVRLGDSLIDDRFPGEQFDYFVSHPPFGLSWKTQREEIARERNREREGRFSAGLPRTGDSSFLFLQHMWDKRRPPESGGSRLAVLFAAAPMSAGEAGSGESEIRRWLLENDWVEAIVALPESLLYDTGIGTYIWLLSNRKEPRRAGKVQLIDARGLWTDGESAGSPRPAGSKRRHVAAEQITEITRLHSSFEECPRSRILGTSEFGYTRVRVEHPLRLRYEMSTEGKRRFLNGYPHLLDDIQAIDSELGRDPALDWTAAKQRILDLLKKRGTRWKAHQWQAFEDVFTETDPEAQSVRLDGSEDGLVPDPGLREFENVPLSEDPEEFFRREIEPYEPAAWLAREADTVGYTINFHRHFHQPPVLRPTEEINTDLRRAEEEIRRLLDKVLP